MERTRSRSGCGEPDDFASLRSLARRLRRDPPDAGVRLSLCSTSSTDLLSGLLVAALHGRGVDADLHTADYGLVHGELLDPSSPTARFAPRVAVVMYSPRDIPDWPRQGATVEEAEELAGAAVEYLLRPCRAALECGAGDVVVTNLHALPERPLGHFGARSPGDANNFIRRVNLRLGDRAPASVHVHDVAALAERMGLDQWLDSRLWHHAKMPASPEAQARLALSLAGHVAGILGCARKCVAVDLDNTLWGGVVGDDGVDGIELGEGNAAGEAFKAFQIYLKSLVRRGIVLAVVSKNEDAVARAAFDHPEMVLTLADFAAFKAGWGPKSEALREIADQLGLGLDAFVFIDDNPAERAEVRSALPRVAVPEMPDDVAEFARTIDRLHAFETGGITAEDRERPALYRARARSLELERSASTYEEFLKSLAMVGTVREWDGGDLSRIAQLIGKTNQYNLTTLRLSRAAVESRARSRDWITLALRLRDRFGDHGLVSAVWARVQGDTLDIEGWVMSCRVLKRGAEHFVFNHLLQAAQRRGVKQVVGRFLPSARNAVAKHHYESLGFVRQSDDETAWRLDVAAANPAPSPVSSGLVADATS